MNSYKLQTFLAVQMQRDQSNMDLAALEVANTQDHKTNYRLFRTIQVSVVTALVVALYARVVVELVQDWWAIPSLSQGMLIPPLALYVAWMRRHLTFGQSAVPESIGLVLMGFALALLVFGRISAELFANRMSLVLLFVSFAWTFWGRARLRTLAFPFVVLASMVPLPVIAYNAIAAPLQLLASEVATEVARLCGVTVFRDGNVIQLAHLSLGVEEACSGLNSLSAMLVASLLLGFLLCSSSLARILLVILAPVVAILVNVARVTGTAILADVYPDLAKGFYHSFTGWLIFLFGFGSLYILAKLLHKLLDTPAKVAH